MKLSEFQTLIAQLPENIPVTRCKADANQFPRVVWNETYFDQTYSSNAADDMIVGVVVEYIARPENMESIWDVIRLLRNAGMPFQGRGGYVEEYDYYSAEFSLQLTEALPDG